MKVEPRGKYAGVKIHLDREESEALLAACDEFDTPKMTIILHTFGRKIHQKMEEFPDLLEDKTEEQIAEALKLEQEKATLKLARIAEGKVWNEEG